MDNQQPVMASNQKMMPIEELFKKSFLLYYHKAFAMLFLILMGGLGCLLIFGVFGLVAALLAVQGVMALKVAAIVVGLVGVLCAIIWELWVYTALIFAVKEHDQQINLKNLLLSVKDKVAPLFWVSLLSGLMVLGGFILFVIPGIIFAIWFCLARYVFAFEGKKGLMASWRSKELVRGYWWPVFGRLLAFMILSMVVSFIPRVGHLISMLFVMPFGIFYMYAIYQDLVRIKG